MTERNRLNIEYLYYSDVTGELDKAYSVLTRALELFPRDVFFHTNLSKTRCVNLASSNAQPMWRMKRHGWSQVHSILAGQPRPT